MPCSFGRGVGGDGAGTVLYGLCNTTSSICEPSFLYCACATLSRVFISFSDRTEPKKGRCNRDVMPTPYSHNRNHTLQCQPRTPRHVYSTQTLLQNAAHRSHTTHTTPHTHRAHTTHTNKRHPLNIQTHHHPTTLLSHHHLCMLYTHNTHHYHKSLMPPAASR